MIIQSAYPNTLKHEVKHEIGDFQMRRMVEIRKKNEDEPPDSHFCGFYG